MALADQRIWATFVNEGQLAVKLYVLAAISGLFGGLISIKLEHPIFELRTPPNRPLTSEPQPDSSTEELVATLKLEVAKLLQSGVQEQLRVLEAERSIRDLNKENFQTVSTLIEELPARLRELCEENRPILLQLTRELLELETQYRLLSLRSENTTWHRQLIQRYKLLISQVDQSHQICTSALRNIEQQRDTILLAVRLQALDVTRSKIGDAVKVYKEAVRNQIELAERVRTALLP
jgi:hypothetical protein